MRTKVSAFTGPDIVKTAQIIERRFMVAMPNRRDAIVEFHAAPFDPEPLKIIALAFELVWKITIDQIAMERFRRR